MCGSRTFTNRLAVGTILDGFWWPNRGIGVTSGPTIVSGGALGADTFAREWAYSHEGVTFIEYKADWKVHGRSAGPIRNQKMLDSQRPDLVLAFVNKPLTESKGTFDMVRRARQLGVPVWVVEILPPRPPSS